MKTISDETLNYFPGLTSEILDAFQFENEMDFVTWAQTLCFSYRFSFDTDEGVYPDGDFPFFGWPSMLITDGDQGVLLLKVAEDDDGIFIDSIGMHETYVNYDWIELFREECVEAELGWEYSNWKNKFV
tara:strand:+ start:1953 stop:2339 length:387 start_codon:yes stop_codon:yes gene_type:complete